MTEPKRWPRYAEDARIETIVKALRMVELGQEVNRALLEGDTVLAMARVGDIIALASQIQGLMNAAKDGGAIKGLLTEGDG
jgi:hypothetical protein